MEEMKLTPHLRPPLRRGTRAKRAPVVQRCADLESSAIPASGDVAVTRRVTSIPGCGPLCRNGGTRTDVTVLQSTPTIGQSTQFPFP
jgi:hypothetical protein